MKHLISQEISISTPGFVGPRPILEVCEHEHVGPTSDDDEHTALLIALEEGHLEVAKIRLEVGTYIHIVTAFGATPLVEASAGDHIEVVKLLLEAGSVIHATSTLR